MYHWLTCCDVSAEGNSENTYEVPASGNGTLISDDGNYVNVRIYSSSSHYSQTIKSLIETANNKKFFTTELDTILNTSSGLTDIKLPFRTIIAVRYPGGSALPSPTIVISNATKSGGSAKNYMQLTTTVVNGITVPAFAFVISSGTSSGTGVINNSIVRPIPQSILDGQWFTVEYGSLGVVETGNYVHMYWKLNDYFVCYGTVSSNNVFNTYIPAPSSSRLQVSSIKCVKAIQDTYVATPVVSITKQKLTNNQYKLTANATTAFEI